MSIPVKRFRLMKYSDVPEELGGYPDDDDYRSALVECDDAGKPIRMLGVDGGEPEDQSFGRDWSWVVDELNRIADENSQ